jgi:hypothetical protein
VKRSKKITLAILATLALTAVMGTASASASKFNVSAAPATLSGSLLGKSHSLKLSTGELSEIYTCTGVAFSGQATEKSFSQFSVNPELSGCSHSTFNNDKWTMNGCKFQFEAGLSGTSGKMYIVGCAQPMVNNAGGCINEIGNQAVTGQVQYANISSSTVRLQVSMSGITFTRKGGPCWSGPTGTFNGGTYTGEWTLSSAGNTVQYESTSPPPPTKFAVEEAPATITGTSTNTKALSFPENGALTCGTVTHSGTMPALTATSITVVPKYQNCSLSFNGFTYPVPDEYISAGGCSFELPYAGGINIVGAKCAAEPFTVTRPSCLITMGPQSVGTGFTYASSGAGKERKVSRGGTLSGLTYTATGVGCSSPGTFSTGIDRSTFSYSAKNSKGEAQGFFLQ